MPEIKFTVSVNEKIIETVTQETNSQPDELVLTLEQFRKSVNDTFTKMIEDDNDIDDYIDEDMGSSDEADDVQISAKKRKK